MNIKLQTFRKSQNLSTKEISDLMGVSKSAYEKVEYGQRSPSFNFVLKFKQKFPQCSTDEMFLSECTR
mgnify:CR=1 FL=1